MRSRKLKHKKAKHFALEAVQAAKALEKAKTAAAREATNLKEAKKNAEAAAKVAKEEAEQEKARKKAAANTATYVAKRTSQTRTCTDAGRNERAQNKAARLEEACHENITHSCGKKKVAE